VVRTQLKDQPLVEAAVMTQIADAFLKLGRMQEAELLHRDALERRRKLLGEDHPDTLQAMNNYAWCLGYLGRWQEAEPFFRDALQRRRRVLGEDHPDTINSNNNYAYVLTRLGR